MDTQSNNTQILVTGGSGLLGKAFCKILDEHQYNYTICTHQREKTGKNLVFYDLRTGEGADEAVKNKKVIIHLASDKKKPDNDLSGTQKLLDAIKKNGERPHIIYMSIVGVDQISLPYFKQKFLTEEVIKKSGLSYSILRSTQFYEYVDEVLRMISKIPLLFFVPKKVPIQLSEVSKVAQELFQLASRIPSNKIENMGGQEIILLKEVVKMWIDVQKKQKIIISFPVWGKWGKNLKAGALTTQDKYSTNLTWEQWLIEKRWTLEVGSK